MPDDTLTICVARDLIAKLKAENSEQRTALTDEITRLCGEKAALKIALKQIAESKPLAGAQGQYRAGMEHAFRYCAGIANEAVVQTAL